MIDIALMLLWFGAGAFSTSIQVDKDRYRISYAFGLATHTRAPHVAMTKVLGIPIYKRAGKYRSLFGHTYLAGEPQ